jgi:hypothetical protein
LGSFSLARLCAWSGPARQQAGRDLVGANRHLLETQIAIENWASSRRFELVTILDPNS